MTVSPVDSGNVRVNQELIQDFPYENSYNVNERVDLFASPKYGYQFSHWDGTVNVEGDSTYLFMSCNKKVVANFKKAENKTLIFPHVLNDEIWESNLTIVNISTAETTLMDVDVFNQSGENIGQIAQVELAPASSLPIQIHDQFVNSAEIQYVKVLYSGGQLKGYVTFTDNDQFQTTVPGVTPNNIDELYVPFIVSSNEWWTGICLLNSLPESKTVTIVLADQNEIELDFEPNAQQHFLARELLPMSSTTSSMVLKAANGILGYVFYGSYDNQTNYLHGVKLEDKLETTLFFPLIKEDSEWWTSLIIFQPDDSGDAVEMEVRNIIGEQVDQIILEGFKGNQQIINMNTYPFSPDMSYIKVQTSQPICGMEFFGTRDGNMVAGFNGIKQGDNEGVIVLSSDESEPGLFFINPVGTEAQLKLTGVLQDGGTIVSENILLAPFERLEMESLANIFTTQEELHLVFWESSHSLIYYQFQMSIDGKMLDANCGS